MKIANPIYDTAFKYLMQNDRIAKKVLSTLLECEILELTIEQQEIVVVDESRGLKLYRLDFSATIVDETGKPQKVLIELQKSKLPTNALRFRTYLGTAYAKREMVVNEMGVEEIRIYPIISIYILGYNVVDIPYLAINIDNKITNTVTKEEVEVTSDFVDLLTHKTRIIQIRRLSKERRTRLERFLMLFNQTWITSERVTLELQEVPEEFSDVAKYLKGAMEDDIFRSRLRAEEEVDAIFRTQEAELAAAWQQAQQAKQEKQRIAEELKKAEAQTRLVKEQIEEAEAQRNLAKEQAKEAEAQRNLAKEQAKEAEAQRNLAKEQAKEAEAQRNLAKEQAEEAKQKQISAQIQFAKYLLQDGKSISEVVQITGLDETIVSGLQ